MTSCERKEGRKIELLWVEGVKEKKNAEQLIKHLRGRKGGRRGEEGKGEEPLPQRGKVSFLGSGEGAHPVSRSEEGRKKPVEGKADAHGRKLEKSSASVFARGRSRERKKATVYGQ